MKFRKIAIIANTMAGTGKDNILDLTKKLFECMLPQVEHIFTGPGEMGEEVCKGNKVTVFGSNHRKTRLDTIETTKEMLANGAELFFIISGDGTYNDTFEAMKMTDNVVPIFGIAAGRFNTIFSYRAHQPFVSMIGDFKAFKLEDLEVKDVIGIETKINNIVRSYGFFWSAPSSTVMHSDETGLIEIDALDYINHKIRKVNIPVPIANEKTEFRIKSQKFGEVLIAKGSNIGRMIVAHLVPELNQIVGGMHGMFLEISGYNGIAYSWDNPDYGMMVDNPKCFPLSMKSAGFFEDDVVEISNLNKTVLMVDSSAICIIKPEDVVSMKVIKKLGKKAVLSRSN